MKKLLLAVNTAGVIFLFAQNVFATAISDVAAWYNWNTLKIQVTYTPDGSSTPITRDAVGGAFNDYTKDFRWYTTPTTANADAANDIQPADTDYQSPVWDWTQLYEANAQVTNAQGLATVTNGGATVTAGAHALSDGIVTSSTSASSAIHRGANFWSNIDALYTFSVDAAIDQTITESNAAESASVESDLHFFLTYNDNYSSYLAEDYDQVLYNDVVDFYNTYTQSVQYNIIATTSNTVPYYTFGGDAHSAASANAPRSETKIPEPATTALLGLGFLGYGLLKRKLKGVR